MTRATRCAEWAVTLIETLVTNPLLTAVHLPFNPAIDEVAQAALQHTVEERGHKLALHFGR